jgi:hypothetical protein
MGKFKKILSAITIFLTHERIFSKPRRQFISPRGINSDFVENYRGDRKKSAE